MHRLLILLILLVLVLPGPGHGQKNLDSLQRALQRAEDPKTQISLMMDMGRYFEHSDLDSAIHFFSKAYELSSEMLMADNSLEDEEVYEKYKELSIRGLSTLHGINQDFEEALKYAEQILSMEEGEADTISLIVAWIALGNKSQIGGSFRQASDQYYKALELAKATNDTMHIAKISQNLGIVHFYMGDLDAAATYTHQALEAYSQKNDLLGKSSCLLMMGNLMYDQEDYKKAMDYYNESYEGFNELNHTIGKYNAILNIGTLLIEEERYFEAIGRFEEAQAMARQISDFQGVVRCLHNMGMSFSRMGDPQKALKHYQEALNLARENNFKHLEANTLSNMAAVNNDLGEYREALNLASRSLQLSSEIQSLDDQIYAYKNLSLAQEGLGNLRQALEYHKLYKLFNDSLTRIENRREISEVENQYQTERIRQEMELQNALLEKQELELTQQSVSLSRQKLIRNFMTGGIVILFLAILQIYNSSRRRKRANALILQQNLEIGEQHERITRQKNIIEEKNQALVSSIRYAQNIQNALLTDDTILQEVFEDYFIIYEPKEIVSGDFYWFSRQNDTTLLALADSTGHGVPGAFLSVLGLSFLNEFMARRKYSSPAQLLDEMRLYIISSLHQHGEQNTVKEGIEMALLAIDHRHRKIIYSGARTPIYVASKWNVLLDGNPLTGEPNYIHKVKGDSMPLAFHRKMNAFSNHILTLNQGDSIYIVTDGFGDQFGSEKKERFTNQRLMKLLEDISDQPMKAQKDILLTTLHHWKQDCVQVDDIAMIGFRL